MNLRHCRSVESLCKALHGRKWWCSCTCDLNDLWWGNSRKSCWVFVSGAHWGFLSATAASLRRPKPERLLVSLLLIHSSHWVDYFKLPKQISGRCRIFSCEWLTRAEKSCIVSKSWPLNRIDGRDILSVWTRESKMTLNHGGRASCGWNSKSKDAARAGFDVCVAAWEALLFICFHWLDVSLCRNRLYLTTVSLTENSSSSSRMTLAGKRLFFLLLSLSPVCSFSLYLFPLNVPAYREKMRDLPLVSLFCSCILPEPREPAADKKEGQ